MDHPLYHPDITELEPVARAAGAAIMAIYSQPFAVEYKSDESPLTAADKGAHEVIVQGLARLTPDIPVLSEESGSEVMAARHSWSRYWLVDPLDGTKEFVSRNGEFTVNIALIEEGMPRWGLVYAPVLDKLWYGGKGVGAWRIADGKCESIQTRPHREGEAWRVVGSRNHLSQETLDFLAPFGELELVSMGSSLKFCIIAEGGRRALSAPRSHLRVGHRCGAGCAGGGRVAASPSSMAHPLPTTSSISSIPGLSPRHKRDIGMQKGRTGMNFQSGLFYFAIRFVVRRPF